MSCHITTCSRKNELLEVKYINFPSIHPIHFPSLGPSFLLCTVGGWPVKELYGSNSLWFFERKPYIIPRVTACHTVTHDDSYFTEKCLSAHSFPSIHSTNSGCLQYSWHCCRHPEHAANKASSWPSWSLQLRITYNRNFKIYVWYKYRP